MNWRMRGVVIAGVLFGSGMTGCNCVGCTSHDVATKSGKDWTVTLTCEANTSIGGGGAAHVGGILYPNGCTTGWKMHAEGSKSSVGAELTGPSAGSSSCTAVRAFCRSARGSVVTREEDGNVVAAAVTDTGWVGAYLFDGKHPLVWFPRSALSSKDDGEATPAVASQTGQPLDASKILLGMPTAELVVAQMLQGSIELDPDVFNALTGARLTRHLDDVRAAIRRCAVPYYLMDELVKPHPDLVEEIYSSAFPRTRARSCYEAIKYLPSAPRPVVQRRLLEDLRACSASCPHERLIDLARLAVEIDSRQAAVLLKPHLAFPTLNPERTNFQDYTYSAWHACAFAVAILDPPSAREPLLLAFAKTAADRDPIPEEHHFYFPLKPRKPDSDGDTSPRSTQVAELLLLVDDPSVRDYMFATSKDAKRSPEARQVGIAYLLAAKDPRADQLFAETNLFGPEQRRALRPSASDAEAP